MGVSYQTKNRLRRKVMTAPLVAPTLPVSAPEPAPQRAAFAWWPVVAAVAVAAAAFFALYRA